MRETEQGDESNVVTPEDSQDSQLLKTWMSTGTNEDTIPEVTETVEEHRNKTVSTVFSHFEQEIGPEETNSLLEK